MFLWGRHDASWKLGAAAELPGRPTLLTSLSRATDSNGTVPVVLTDRTFRAEIDLREVDGSVTASVHISTTKLVAHASLLLGALAWLRLCNSCGQSQFLWLAGASLLITPAALVRSIVKTRLLLRRACARHVPPAKVVR